MLNRRIPSATPSPTQPPSIAGIEHVAQHGLAEQSRDGHRRPRREHDDGYDAEKTCTTSARRNSGTSLGQYTLCVMAVRRSLILCSADSGPGARGSTGNEPGLHVAIAARVRASAPPHRLTAKNLEAKVRRWQRAAA